jgi:hypothetical protein
MSISKARSREVLYLALIGIPKECGFDNGIEVSFWGHLKMMIAWPLEKEGFVILTDCDGKRRGTDKASVCPSNHEHHMDND